MTLLSEIIDAASGDTVPRSTFLRKLKVLAAGPEHDTGEIESEAETFVEDEHAESVQTSPAPELRAWSPARRGSWRRHRQASSDPTGHEMPSLRLLDRQQGSGSAHRQPGSRQPDEVDDILSWTCSAGHGRLVPPEWLVGRR
jgi:hypothetical protein